MINFIYALCGTLIGSFFTAFLGLYFWRKQKHFEMKLKIIQDLNNTLNEFIVKQKTTNPDPELLKQLEIQLRSILGLAEIFYGKNIRNLSDQILESYGIDYSNHNSEDLIITLFNNMIIKLK